MTLAADHVCFRSSWSHLAAAKSAKHIVGELFECAGVPMRDLAMGSRFWKKQCEPYSSCI